MIPQRKTKSSPRVSVLSIIVSALIQAIAVSSWADVFEVDRFDDPLPVQVCDSGTPMDCSLREAVINASEAEIVDLTIRGGSWVSRAGGIYNRAATLTVERSTITGNSANNWAAGLALRFLM